MKFKASTSSELEDKQYLKQYWSFKKSEYNDLH
jgi:hypothetical protein